MKKIFISLALAAAALFTAATTALAAHPKDTLAISILGDSYSTYEGRLTPDTNAIWYYRPENPRLAKHNDVRNVEETWWYQTIANLNGKLEINNSYSGATICQTGYRKGKEVSYGNSPIPGYEAHANYSDRAFITRSNKLGNPDVILICGATNDSWCGAPIGEYVYGNWSNEQLFYFRPAMAKLLHDIRANYPTAMVLFILNSELKESINESVHTICRHYAVPCLDLKDINKQGGHPSIAGMKSISDQVTKRLRDMIARRQMASKKK